MPKKNVELMDGQTENNDSIGFFARQGFNY